ncbi:MAG TPA: hypothetical protein DET40_19655 [Lentisphaeria bacterium]|nr:MAG: hypothetical protein A2X45_11230 [Lentisphaerae bacterium GWF2_50_93]HCE45765.1 hypothetical protein [Lentisphaeria bacterium]
MQLRIFKSLFILLLSASALLICTTNISYAAFQISPGDIKLPFLHPLFGKNAVIQSGAKVPVWGWTNAGAKVHVDLKDGKGESVSRADSVAGTDGLWKAVIGPIEAGGPFTLAVDGPSSVKSENILVGELWLCSGQSNMNWPLSGIPSGKDEIAKADWPQLRTFLIQPQLSVNPELSFRSGSWTVCTPETAKNFSALSYFFGRELHQALKRPVGLINSSWGGTGIQAWSSIDTLKDLLFSNTLQEEFKVADKESKNPNHAKEYEDTLEKWFKENDPGSSAGWAGEKLDLKDWTKINVPVSPEKSSVPNGVLWLRRTFTVPADWAGKDAEMLLGCVDISDWNFVYMNGQQIGCYYNREMSNLYKVPAGMLKTGENTIARRIVGFGHSGFRGKAEHLWIRPRGAPDTKNISLAGEWYYREGILKDKFKSDIPKDTKPHQNTPGVLFNGMISPLIPAVFKGCIWYQGEASGSPGEGVKYATYLKNMITDWRKRFGNDFAFGVVQLPNFNAISKVPVEDKGWNGSWVDVRESQMETSRILPNVGCIATIDLGDAGNIHPARKLEVGQRLAGWAMSQVYGTKAEFSGPVYDSMKVEGSNIRISFKHIGDGLASKDGTELKWFAICGADKKFIFAKAKIDGDTVIVSSPEIPNPVAVRYAWVQNPDPVNFYNKNGFPAVPFKTDK